MDKQVLSLPEALEFLGISRSLLFKLMKDREIRFVKVRKRLLFRKVDLDAFLAARVVK